MTDQPNVHVPISGPEFDVEEFRQDVLAGLTACDKSLPCKYLYDEQGSQLFVDICELDEYYPTRTELAIMRRYAEEISDIAGPKCLVVELGSGSSEKTHVLLDAIEDPSAYVPIDISRESLERASARLAREYPSLEILPLHADFTSDFALPRGERPYRRPLVFFPGSTIGNFSSDAARSLLNDLRRLAGKNAGLLIGVDIKKDPNILYKAYNDGQGVTEQFNLNLLSRMNRELDTDFQIDEFSHEAIYNPREGRVEMYIVSQQDQTVTLDDIEIEFDEGERICTEWSHKYSIDEFRELAADAGWELRHAWTDAEELFSVQYYDAADARGGQTPAPRGAGSIR